MRLLQIPLFGYFRDFGFLDLSGSGNITIAHILRFCHILGLSLETEKSEICPVVTFPGHRRRIPTPSNAMTLRVSIDPRNAAKRDIAILANL